VEGYLMKKVLLVVLLLLGMAVLLHAQESADSDESSTSEEKTGGFGGHIRVGYGFPFLSGFLEYDSDNAGEAFANNLLKFGLSLAFSSLAVGGGFQYDVVPHIFAPGIYFDVNFNLFSWAIMSMFDRRFIMLQFGFRVYNQFSIAWFALEPFFGGNYIYLKYMDSSVPVFLLQGGFVMNLGRFSFEYGYHFPTKSIGIDEFSFRGIHRITFSGIVFKK
jgi:hypothetical protein